MAEEIVTRISLKEIAGVPSVVWNGIDLHNRKACKDRMGYVIENSLIDKPHLLQSPMPPEGAEGYVRLPNVLVPNIYSAQELLSACEWFDRPPISPWLGGDQIYRNGIAVSDEVDPDALLDALGVERRTVTIRRKTAEAIGKWCYGSNVSSAIPVKDIVGMANDMRALITMLLFSVGDACTPEMLARNVPNSLAMFDPECECYRNYIQGIPPWMLPDGIDGVSRDYEDYVLPIVNASLASGGQDHSAQETLRWFCNGVVSMLMYPLAPTLTFDGFYVGGEYASLGGAYAFWTHEALYGKAAVCKYCGRLFLRKRRSGEYCSKSCKQGWNEYRKND